MSKVKLKPEPETLDAPSTFGGRRPSSCSPGESGEAYYCKRDDFTRYLEEVVNPARIAANLAPLDKRTAEECYRILNEFARKRGCKPIEENVQGHPRLPVARPMTGAKRLSMGRDTGSRWVHRLVERSRYAGVTESQRLG